MTLKHTPIPVRLYEYNVNGYCGVFMTESVMKKIVKLSNKYQDEVRKILFENKGDLYAQGWSLAYPNGEQTHVYFANKEGVERRIELFKAYQPTYRSEVYLGDGHCENSKEVINQIETIAAAKGE